MRFSGTVLPNVLARVGALTGFSLLLRLLERYLLGEIGYPLLVLEQICTTIAKDVLTITSQNSTEK